MQWKSLRNVRKELLSNVEEYPGLSAEENQEEI